MTIAVDEDVQRVRELLLEVVKNDDDFLDLPEPRVVVTGLNDYNVAVELQAWLKNERNHVEMRSQLRERVFNKLNAANVDMPYETLQIISTPA